MKSKKTAARPVRPKVRAKPVRVAVVGLGFMGVTHLRVYQEIAGVQIVAVCDAVRLPVNGILEGVTGNIKKSDDIDLGRQVKVFRELSDVLALPEVDLVDLCTPTPLHPRQAVAALKAGKHVLCEKPLARTSLSAKGVLEVANSSPGFLMPAMCMRFWPGWSWLKEVVEKKSYGKILSASFRRLSEMPRWSKQGTYTGGADPGGALFDLHIHDTDFVQFLFGKPRAVFSTGVTSAGGSIDHVATQYMYPGGPAVYAEGSWLMAQGFNMAYTIHLERATLDFDLTRGAKALLVLEQGKSPSYILCDGPDGYSNEIRYFVEAVRSRTAPVTVTALDGLGALKICEAEEKSVRTGQVVQI
ncbi:MAG: oxidoreductase [Verrucomicrobia bacterium]|nr:MAG: oxidoreductase [Verrucomicrobiota bacterium]